MKKPFALFLIAIWLTACAPSPQAIQTAIAQTQAANPTSTFTPIPPTETQIPTDTSTQTLTPKPTITFTPSITMTPTNLPTTTHTPEPATYIFEWGICTVDVTMDDLFADSTAENPGKHPGCLAVGRTQYVLGYSPKDNSYAYWNMPQIYTNMGEEAWCTLKALDGTFMQGDLDTFGAGKVTCGIK